MSPTTFFAVISSRFLARSFRLTTALLALAGMMTAHAELTLVERWPTGENVCAYAPLRLTFDKPPVLGGTGKIEVCHAKDDEPVEAIVLGEAQHVDRFGVNGGFMLRYEPERDVTGPTLWSVRFRESWTRLPCDSRAAGCAPSPN